MMQDTVLELTKRCFLEFREYLFVNIPKKVEVINASRVINEYVTEEEKRTLSTEVIAKL